MFSWLKSKPKEQWCLVRTITVPVSHSARKGKLYYHLYESDRKNRKVEFACTIPEVDAEKSGKHFDVYHETIYRWLQGRIDPEIPRYDQIHEEDVVNVLKGKVQ